MWVELPAPAEPAETFCWFACSQAFSPWERGPRHHHVGIAGEHRDRLEVLLDVVIELVDRAVEDMRAEKAELKRVSVGRRPDDAAGADGAGRAGDVLDDDRLAERRPHRLGEDTGHGVERAAGRERHHDGDRTRRIGLRRTGPRPETEASQHRAQRYDRLSHDGETMVACREGKGPQPAALRHRSLGAAGFS
jgi:hypothetical protein